MAILFLNFGHPPGTMDTPMKPIVFEFTDGNEYLSSHSGLGLIGALLSRTKLKERLSQIELPGCREPKISHSDIVYSMTGLLCLGKPDFDSIEPFRLTPFFFQSLGIEHCPASATLRQRLDVVGDYFDGIIKEESALLLSRTAPHITPLSTTAGEYVPFDMDVSPFDNSKTKKEGVSRTYKGFDGYAPIFSYVGREGYLVNAALRVGKQHCQNGTPEFFKESLIYAKKITGDKKLLVRMDSGNDCSTNIAICINEKVAWLIKRNIRNESPEQWLQLAKDTGKKVRSSQGTTVWHGATYRNVKDIKEPLRLVFSVTERTINSKGQVLLIPEIEIETYWTSLDLPPNEIITLYHAHAECEQFHSELKTDMDLERLPSEHFATNAIVLLLGMLAYNLLRLCGQESLREDSGNIQQRPTYRRKAFRRRLRTVMQDLIYMACRITHHAKKWRISFGIYNPWSRIWLSIYLKFREPVLG